MPTLDFKGKSIIYSHHLTVPSRALEENAEKSLPPRNTPPRLMTISSFTATTCMLLKPCCRVMREWLKNKSPVDGEDLERHDKWLCMMWPRLNLLRELLAEDGVIFISIDDNEQHHLRMVMDEIFLPTLYGTKKKKLPAFLQKINQFPIKNISLVYCKHGTFSFNGVPTSINSYNKDKEGKYYRTMPIQATGKQNN